MLLGCTPLFTLKRSVCAASDGSCFDNDECAVPFMCKDTPSPSSEFLIQTYPSISRAMGALDVVFEFRVRKMYVRSIDLIDLTMLFRWLLCSMLCANPSCCAILLVHLAKHGTFDHDDVQLTASRQNCRDLALRVVLRLHGHPDNLLPKPMGILVLTKARFCWC